MNTLLGNSSMPNYVKIMATTLLGLTYLAALAVALDIYVSQGANAVLPNLIALVLGTGLGVSLNILGIHQGAQLAEHAGPETNTTSTTSNVTTKTAIGG